MRSVQVDESVTRRGDSSPIDLIDHVFLELSCTFLFLTLLLMVGPVRFLARRVAIFGHLTCRALLEILAARAARGALRHIIGGAHFNIFFTDRVGENL